jgi:hypothetical protein
VRQAGDFTADMKYAFFLVTMTGWLVLTGCQTEKSFEVTGVVPPSQMRAAAAPQRRRPEPLVVKAPQRDRLAEPVARATTEPTPRPTTKPVVKPMPKPVAKEASVAQPATVAFPEPAATATEARTVTLVADTGLVGKVASVNASLHFVVLNFPVGRMAEVDQAMGLYRQGQKIGEVKITGPQQDDNIIADITAGEAEAGDEVREK